MRSCRVQNLPFDTCSRRRGQNRIGIRFNPSFGSLGLDQPENLHTGLAIIPFSEQPAGAFGQAKAERGIRERRKRGYAKHPAPGILAHARQQRVGQKSDQDAEDDIELKHPRQPTAVLRWGNF